MAEDVSNPVTIIIIIIKNDAMKYACMLYN